MSSKLYGNRWEIVRTLNEGGQGVIFLVQDKSQRLQGEYILKRFKKQNGRSSKEIEAIKQLDHPNIAKIIDYSLEDPPFYVTEYFPKTLSDIAPLKIQDALDIVEKISTAIDYAHTNGVIHRDIKPDNILIKENNEPIIIDFGLCYFVDVTANRITKTMEQVGSRFYMAPELENGRADNIGSAVDSYAIGKLLYFILTNKHVSRENFDGDNSIEKILKNPQLGYITERIFPNTISVNASKRILPRDIIMQIKVIRHLINEHFYPGKEGSLCRFCGEGEYISLPETTLRINIPGLETNAKFKVLRCSICNNIQWFGNYSRY